MNVDVLQRDGLDVTWRHESQTSGFDYESGTQSVSIGLAVVESPASLCLTQSKQDVVRSLLGLMQQRTNELSLTFKVEGDGISNFLSRLSGDQSQR